MKSVLRKLLSPSLVSSLKSVVERVDKKIIPFFASNSFLSSFYYCFFSTKFRREHQSVLKGRLAYKASLDAINHSSVLLRRNTHRLEKGLIMQPRREIFAEAYIEETVECFRKCIASSSICSDELKWAQDVLVSYFAIVGDSDIINNAKARFETLTLKSFECASESLPYQHQARVQAEVSSDQLLALFQQRRSVRWYEQKPVELELIKQAIEMASQAPSACNRQPFQFYTITDMNKASDVASIAMGTTGFSDNIPALIVVMGDLSAYPAERDRHVIYIDGGLASMQLMLAFETLGLSSCPINWPDIEICERKIAKKLALDKHLRPIMLMSVGYGQSTGKIPYSQKKSAEILLKEVN
ncbi:nitroreductase family protein [Thalassotalea sp. 1_MG-2023]|uniref:nitroreductase family protein n=1 Tax=Thalassotalea sp. 1_MG-2023 TaxID=3062680 RepID=UPI0026E2813A|nr:nitroreductase family protein [Thalassotalea sp. 1_MG-2023]MDO6426508.1 nitroreductase family protein [Thalassotalea sp. 1_MG-2023]